MRLTQWFVLLLISGFACATGAKPLTVGIQNIHYYPHYDFSGQQASGYIYDLLELFAANSQYEFIYVPLPIKRLQHELLNTHQVDLMYPDNPRWAVHQKNTEIRHFSPRLVNILGGTMVLSKNQDQRLSEFETLSVPRGFTPVEWLKIQHQNRVQMVEVGDGLSALKMVLLGRADGADVEFNVATHILKSIGQSNQLSLAPHLPYSETGFHLSTVHYAQVMVDLEKFLYENQAEVKDLKQKYALIETFEQWSQANEMKSNH